MIEDPPVLKIRSEFARPSAEHIAAIQNTPVGFLVDAMHGRGAMAPAIKPLATDGSMPMTFCGPAFTCWCSPNDNLGALAALKYAQPGDVIVAACEEFGTAAVIGDRVLGMARMHPDRVEAELSWIDDHIDGKPYGIDVLMPSTFDDVGEQLSDGTTVLTTGLHNINFTVPAAASILEGRNLAHSK